MKVYQRLYFKTSSQTNARIMLIGFLVIITGRYHIFSFIQSAKVTMNIQTILLVILCIFIYFVPRWTHVARIRYKSFVTQWAFIFGIFYLIIQGLAGIIFGFGKSPFRQDILSVIHNILFFGLPIISRELVRSYCINGYVHKTRMRTSIILIIIFTFIEFNIGKYTSLTSIQDLVEFCGEYFLPALSKQTFITMLSFLAGSIPAVVYSIIIEFPPYLSPILPNLNWLINAFIGILTPIFSLFILQSLCKKELRTPIRVGEKENPFTLALTVIMSICIIWFSAGVFSIYPSVIATGSMEPMIYPGDVILVKKINNDNIKTLTRGDVIQFRREDILISHRIIEVIRENEEIIYRTKGDNNSCADGQLVKMEDVKGIIKQVIPKIGWPTLILKKNDDVNHDELEF